MRKRKIGFLAGCMVLACAAADPAPVTIATRALPKIGQVSDRFVSYNIEMVELTGGRFWRPFGSPGTDRYEYRPPIDLANPKLRALAAALGPAYVRFSGTWANATWFATDEAAPDKPPAGFDTVLTHQEWRGAIAFAKAVNAGIVTSFTTSPGVRDAQGVWQPDMAARWLAFTRQAGGELAASEFANEPNMISLTKPPAGYTPADYRRDYARFVGWLRQASPKTLLLAPGVAELGEPVRTLSRQNKSMPFFEGADLLTPDSPRPDGFSFHFYGGGSLRCGGQFLGMSAAQASTPEWLAQIDPAIARVKALRDHAAPGTPLWDTETGETACGGNPWASTFADTFRFVDTLGRSAQQGVQVTIHNTLAASDYALLDEKSYDPRPDYWAALLWRRTMGTTVLAAPASPVAELRLYAHCLAGKRGVGVVAINLGDTARAITLGHAAKAWVMQGQDKGVTINGTVPHYAGGTFTGLTGAAIGAELTVPGKSIAFLADAGARNPACR
jgi:hypothetical protein